MMKVLFTGASVIALAAGGVVRAQTAVDKANADSTTAAITGRGSVLQLAIPVEISSSGVRVTGPGRVIRVPRPQPGSGPQLEVTLEGAVTGGEKYVRRYEVPDPRRMEIEQTGQTVAAAAQTYVYVELTDAASRIDVRPKRVEGASFGPMMQWGATANFTIPLSSFSSVACTAGNESTPLCRQIAPGNK